MDLSPDLSKEQLRILTDTILSAILNSRLAELDEKSKYLKVSQNLTRSHKGLSPEDYTFTGSSLTGSSSTAGLRTLSVGAEGWATLSAKFRRKRSSTAPDPNIRKPSQKSRKGSTTGRIDYLGPPSSDYSDRERTSSLSSTRSRFSFNFGTTKSSTPPPSSSFIEDSEMDSRATDPERVSYMLLCYVICYMLL